MHFEGKAAIWYQSFITINPHANWQQIISSLALRFEELRMGQVIDDFKKLRFGGDYEDYVDKFEVLRDYLNTLNGFLGSEEYYIANFIGGLPTELKSMVRMMNPITLQHAIDLGRSQFEANEALTRKIKSTNRLISTGVTPSMSSKAPVHSDGTPTK